MKTYTEGEILKELRERFQSRAGENQTQKAAKLGFSVQYIQMVLSGSRPLTEQMAYALGFKKNVTYTKKVV